MCVYVKNRGSRSPPVPPFTGGDPIQFREGQKQKSLVLASFLCFPAGVHGNCGVPSRSQFLLPCPCLPFLNPPHQIDEQRDQVTVERALRVVFLDRERANPALEKLKRQLAEADAALETRKKPPADTGPKVIGKGLVIDEWKERREKYLARQQVEAVVSA